MTVKMTVNVSLCGSVPRSQMCVPELGRGNRGGSVASSNGACHFDSSFKSDLTKAIKNSVDLPGIVRSAIPTIPPLKHEQRGFFNGDVTEHDLLKTDGAAHDSDNFSASDKLLKHKLSITFKDMSKPLQPSSSPSEFAEQNPLHQSLVKTDFPPLVEPPSWAVPAKGEARLEPVCEAVGLQRPVDLTVKACFRVGRSPSSDVQLLHNTSSRRHALLFHHPNGSCYVVDCGSAHGTYVNGIRVNSNVLPNNPSANMVIPHRIRRGALVRFGGPGAPCFVLKSFTVGFDSLVTDLSRPIEVSEECIGFASPKEHPTLSPTRSLHKASSTETQFSKSTDSTTALVTLNTRLNALGGTFALPPAKRRIARLAMSQLTSRFYLNQSSSDCYIGKRHHADAVSCPSEPDSKRVKTFNETDCLQPDIALVSPTRIKNTLSLDMAHAIVSPNLSEDISINANDLTPMVYSADFSGGSSKGILSVPNLSARRNIKRVKFSDIPDISLPFTISPINLLEHKEPPALGSDLNNSPGCSGRIHVREKTTLSPRTPRILASI